MKTKQFIAFLESKFKTPKLRFAWSNEGDCVFFDDLVELIKSTAPKNKYAYDFLNVLVVHCWMDTDPYFFIMADAYYHPVFHWGEMKAFIRDRYSGITGEKYEKKIKPTGQVISLG